MLIIALFSIPFIAALITIVTKRSYRLIEIVAIIAALAEAVLVIGVARPVQTIWHTTIAWPSITSYQISGYFSFDALSVYIVSLIATVIVFTTWYAIGYFRKEVEKNILGFRRVRQFYALFHLCVMAMFLAVSSLNPLVFWISLEATSLTSVFLVSLYNKPKSTEAAWKYLIINSLALLLALLGTTLLTAMAGTQGVEGIVTWDSLIGAAPHINPLVAKIAFVFILVGYGTKVGWAPLHTWKPDAYSKAPTPLTALMASGFLALAWYGMLRFFLVGNAIGIGDFIRTSFLIFGVASVVLGALIMMVQRNYKRFFAYSSIEHAGLLAIGFGLGNVFGIYASLLHLLYHSLAKPLAFFGAGNVFLKYGTTKLSHVRGLVRVAPVTAGIMIVACVTLMGLPPFGIFSSELTLLLAAFASHPYVGAVISIFLVLSFIATLRMVAGLLTGESPENVEKGEPSSLTLAPAIVLGILLLVLSVWLPLWFPTLFQNIILAFS